jgi:DUF1009 family protein
MVKLGLIAGGGELPISLARHCLAVGRPVFILRLAGFADSALKRYDGLEVGLAELGKGLSALRRAGCGAVCFAGKVDRPDLSTLKPDLRGLAALPGAVAAARRGDDGLLSFLLREFEKEGFPAEGAHEVMNGLTLPDGAIGRHEPNTAQMADVRRALDAARAIGRLDIGQAAVCCDGLILALEAQEGTDAMLARICTLSVAVRGTMEHRRGVLAKAVKPGQELRVDLPTIGPETIRRAEAAHLVGVAGEARRILLVDREETVRLADAAGLFIVGVPAAPP